jgi:hypothetical protein
MLVLQPLKVTITNAEACEDIVSTPPIGAPYTATFGRTVFIEQSDFREQDSKVPPALLTGDELAVLYSNGPDDRSVKLALGYVTAATSGC